MERKQSTSVSLTPTQKTKLRQLAATLQATPNTVMGMLVDNATVATVERKEAVVTLPTQNKSASKLGSTGAFAN